MVVGTGGYELRQVLACDFARLRTTGRLRTGRGPAVDHRQLERLLVRVDGTPAGSEDDVVVVVEVFEAGSGDVLVVVDVADVEIVAVDVVVAEVMGVDEADATASGPEVTVLAVVALDFVVGGVVAAAVGLLAATVAPRAAAAAATHPDGADMARAPA